MLRLALMVMLSYLAPLSWAEPSLRTQTVLLTANALVYFDADPRVHPDERHLLRMQQAGQGLRRQLDARAWPASLRQAADTLLVRQDALVAVPREQAPRYPQLLVALLDARLQLDEQLQPHEQQANAQRQVLLDLNQAIGELLISALARNARVLGDHSLKLDQNGFLALDRQVEAGFAKALQQLPTQAQVLHKQHLTYRFVRKLLLDVTASQIDGSLERYTAGVLVNLDALANDLTPSP